MATQTPEGKAKAAYPTATKAQKKIYEGLFGKDTFIDKSTKLVGSLKEACKLTGDNPNTCLPYKATGRKKLTEEQMILNAIAELRIIAKALKGTHKANWKNSSETKWTPVFDGSRGFAYSRTGCAYTYSDTVVGSRFAFPDEATATHFGVHFNDLHKIVLSHD